MLLLVVGCINKYPPPGLDWDVLHVDLSDRGIWDPALRCNVPVDIVADMRDMPIASRSVDRLQSWHALEHLNEQGGRDAVKEFARVLKPHGVLDIRVPDMNWVRYNDHDSIEPVLPLIYGDQTPMADVDMNVHRWGYTRASLARLLSEFGFDCESTKAEYPHEIQLMARFR